MSGLTRIGNATAMQRLHKRCNSHCRCIGGTDTALYSGPDSNHMMALPTSDNAGAADASPVSVKSALLQASGLRVRLAEDAGVQDISFAAVRGDIVGLLGLNGAGKSTTLRLLCGVLVPDEGSVFINGYSMADEPLKARTHIGYLPDQPPLYDDLRVHEYLSLAARIRGLKGRHVDTRLAVITDECVLGDVQHKLIGTLSKGYRQRVGLAQALIHDPAVVLLDEPANGLDPQQMEGMRNLLRRIGQDRVIIFSTHLLPEVTATCNRMLIIHDGRLVADRPCNGDDLERVFHGATT